MSCLLQQDNTTKNFGRNKFDRGSSNHCVESSASLSSYCQILFLLSSSIAWDRRWWYTILFLLFQLNILNFLEFWLSYMGTHSTSFLNNFRELFVIYRIFKLFSWILCFLILFIFSSTFGFFVTWWIIAASVMALAISVTQMLLEDKKLFSPNLGD